MSGFIVHARMNNILTGNSKPPINVEDIRTRLSSSHGAPPPSEAEYAAHVFAVGTARNEATMTVEMSGLFKKHYDKGYSRTFNHAFTAFPKNCGFNNGMSAPQPDFIEGLDDFEFHPFPVDEVRGAVLYKTESSIVLPHLAGEYKAGERDLKNARLQSAYDGAALVYARNKTLAFFQKADPAGHAAVLTFTTNGSQLNIFAHYAMVSEADGQTPEFHQYLVLQKHLTVSWQQYSEGRQGLWNAQDFAKEQSLGLRDQLQQDWKQHLRSRAAIVTISQAAASCQQAQVSHLAALPSGSLTRSKDKVPGGGGTGFLKPTPRRTSTRLRAIGR